MTVAQVGSVLGLVLLLAVFYDLFQSVILPRPAVNKVTAARIVLRPMWRLWRWVSQRSSRIDRSEGRLAAFAPIALLMLFFIWAAAAVVGYGLIIDGLADQFRPSPQDLATSIYISATTLVPLSYGDFVPEGGLAIDDQPVERNRRRHRRPGDHTPLLAVRVVSRPGGDGGFAGCACRRPAIRGPDPRERGQARNAPGARRDLRRLARMGGDGAGKPPRIPAAHLLPVQPLQRSMDQLLRGGDGRGRPDHQHCR